jgi:hypothetical protein
MQPVSLNLIQDKCLANWSLKLLLCDCTSPEEGEILPQFARKTKIATHSSGLLVYVFDPGSNVHCGMTLIEILLSELC